MDKHQQIAPGIRKITDRLRQKSAFVDIRNLRDRTLHTGCHVHAVYERCAVGDGIRHRWLNHSRRIAINRIVRVGDHPIGGKIYCGWHWHSLRCHRDHSYGAYR